MQVDIDAGSAVLRQTDLPESVAAASGIAISKVGSRSAFGVTMLGACGGVQSCALQGVAKAALFAAAPAPARWYLAMSGSDITYNGTGPITGSTASLLEFLGDERHVLYFGGGLGVVRQFSTRAAGYGEIGGFWDTDGGRWSMDVREMHEPTAQEVGTTGPSSASLPTATYTDVESGWSRELRDGRVVVSANGGFRHVLSGTGVPNAGYGTAMLTGWLRPHIAIVLAAGHSLEDLMRGTPASSYLSVSLRVRLRGPASWIPRRAFPATVPVATARRIGRGLVTEIRVHVVAESVQLMADFTDWASRPLKRDGDVWMFMGVASPGLHRLAIRVNGGAWEAPINLPTVRDDFGDVVGLITIP
jgi:hypothetical protein